MQVPYPLLHNIEAYIEDKLMRGIPFVSISGVYDAFRNELTRSGLPSKAALYACLRNLEHPGLDYPRYPQVVRKGMPRISVPVAMEWFIKDAGGPVTYGQVRDFAIRELGINKEFVRNYISKVPNVVTVDTGVFVHSTHFRK